MTYDGNATSVNRYAHKQSANCFQSGTLFRKCCCKQPDAAKCWSRGRNFVRCCSGSLHRCAEHRQPQLHVIAYGMMSEATMVLAHSVMRALGTPLLHFGQHRDHEPLPYHRDDAPIAKHLIRKLLLTKEALEVLPPEDFVMYLDATDTLLQRGSRGDLLATYASLVERERLRTGAAWRGFGEPVVFAGQQHCHPFQIWSTENRRSIEIGDPWRDAQWVTAFQHRVYGLSGMGRILHGGQDVCARVNSSGSLPYLDSGAWMGRVAGARHLFGVAAGLASAERATHCMEVLKLTQIWFPGLAMVDTEAEIFWTPELQLPSLNGYVSDEHPAVSIVKESTERSLCVVWEDLRQGVTYWDASTLEPPDLRLTGSRPFALHFAGPSKTNLGRLCWAAYFRTFLDVRGREPESWSLHDLDAGKTVKLSLDTLQRWRQVGTP